MKYFDAHAHIQFDMFDSDRGALLQSMQAEQIGALIVGVDEKSSNQAIELCATTDFLFPSVGLHPNYATESTTVAWVRTLALNERVRAIGECGLDYFRPDNVAVQKPIQKRVFAEQVAIAREVGKPLMMHGRPSRETMDAYEDMLDILEESAAQGAGGPLRGNIHFFVGSKNIAQRFLALDFTLSFTAVLTFTHDYDEVVKFIPLTHILTETDSPYVAPAPHRGQRNDPRGVKAVVERIAEIKGLSEAEVSEAVLKNARQRFGF